MPTGSLVVKLISDEVQKQAEDHNQAAFFATQQQPLFRRPRGIEQGPASAGASTREEDRPESARPWPDEGPNKTAGDRPPFQQDKGVSRQRCGPAGDTCQGSAADNAAQQESRWPARWRTEEGVMARHGQSLFLGGGRIGTVQRDKTGGGSAGSVRPSWWPTTKLLQTMEKTHKRPLGTEDDQDGLDIRPSVKPRTQRTVRFCDITPQPTRAAQGMSANFGQLCSEGDCGGGGRDGHRRNLCSILWGGQEGHDRPTGMLGWTATKRTHRLRALQNGGHITVRDLVQPKDWLTKIDISDAYPHIAIPPKLRHLFRFVWNGKTFQYRSMCFGLSSAPRVWTRIMKPIVNLLRQLGIRCVIYLDDLLLLNSSPQEAREVTQMVLNLLEYLGLMVKPSKVEAVPTQRIEFLGMMIDTVRMLFTVPEHKVSNLRKTVRQTIDKSFLGQLTKRQLAGVIGKVTAMAGAVHPARLHTWPLIHELNLYRRDRWDKRLPPLSP